MAIYVERLETIREFRSQVTNVYGSKTSRSMQMVLAGMDSSQQWNNKELSKKLERNLC